MRGLLALLLTVLLAGCSGCHDSGLAGDARDDDVLPDIVDPAEDLGELDIPDLSDPDIADTFDAPDIIETPDVPDAFDPPWDPGPLDPFPDLDTSDPYAVDPWVPDAWDVSFDYMDIPPDYEPDTATCGNSTVDPGEECDDGNTNNNDECTNACLFPRCGDGIVWHAWEDCDPPGAVRPCTTSCGSTGGEWCEVFCRWTGTCIPPAEICGNGMDDDCDSNADSIMRITGNVPISHLPVSEVRTDLVWTGSRFTVLWSAHPDLLVASHLDEWGRKIDWDRATPVSLIDHWHDMYYTGSYLGLAMRHHLCRFQALNLTGVPSSPLLVMEDMNGSMGAAWSGSEYGIVVEPWPPPTEDREMVLYSVPPDGSSATETAVVRTWRNTEGDYRIHAMAWTGSLFAMHSSHQTGISGAWESTVDLLRPDGTIVDTLILGEPSAGLDHPRGFGDKLLWTGTHLVTTAYATTGDAHVLINNMDGTLAASAVFPETGDIVWTGSRIGVAWVDDLLGTEDNYFAEVTTTGSLAGGIARLTRTPPWTHPPVGFPNLAWTGSSYGIVWRDFDGVDLDIYFAHIVGCP